MGSLLLASIDGVPHFNTYNGRYECNARKDQKIGLWTSAQPEALNEGPSGSLNCITFKIQKDPATGLWGPIPLSVSATSPLLPQWYKPPSSPPTPPAEYKISAGFEGKAALLVSDKIPINNTNPAIAIWQMYLTQAVEFLPFRNAGDWTWSIERTDVPCK
jgi:hypothetical protein